ncbi:MAG: DUF975 family protein [Clostridiales bacterium]|nr:DUF975 family protein [Clostridiales bacterium]
MEMEREWSGKELKASAKRRLKTCYWKAVLVSLIVIVVSAVSSGSDNLPDEVSDLPSALGNVVGSSVGGGMGATQYILLILGILGGAAFVLMVISTVFAVLVLPVLKVGKNRFYLEMQQKGKDTEVNLLLWGFRNHYGNILLTLLARALLTTLGTICLIIPGIYLEYCFLMVPYILAENPEMKTRDALRLSREMMKGQKWKTFLFHLSFIGWVLVACVTLGIGTFFILPYIETSYAGLYTTLKNASR